MKKLLLFALLIIVALFLLGCTSQTPVCGDGICSEQESNADSSYFCTSDCKSEINIKGNNQVGADCTYKGVTTCTRFNPTCCTGNSTTPGKCYSQTIFACCNDGPDHAPNLFKINPMAGGPKIGPFRRCCFGVAAYQNDLCCKNSSGTGFTCNAYTQKCGTNTCIPRPCTTVADCGGERSFCNIGSGYGQQGISNVFCNTSTGKCEINYDYCDSGKICENGNCIPY